jgi:hypothetical protein
MVENKKGELSFKACPYKLARFYIGFAQLCWKEKEVKT